MLKRLLTARAAQLTKRRVAIAESLLGGKGICMLDVGAAEGAPSRWYPYASLVDYVAVEPRSALGFCLESRGERRVQIASRRDARTMEPFWAS